MAKPKRRKETDAPPKPPARLYLSAPRDIDDPAAFIAQCAGLMAAGDVACLRIPAPDAALVRALEPICARHDAALLCDDPKLASGLRLDGAHLAGGHDYQAARETVGENRIVGVNCGLSRHAGLIAAENGADYAAFGPVEHEDCLELLAWWQDYIETPCVAYGAITPQNAAALGAVADFLAPAPDIWARDDSAAFIRAVQEAIGATSPPDPG